MKTRIVYPQLWLDKNYKKCSLETKVLFSFLINNPFLGLSRYSRIDDEQICFSTGLKETQLEKAKSELQALKWCYFHGGEWIYHNHECAYMDFDGRDRVIEAKNKELANVPQVIKDVIKGFLTGSEPVLNPKPIIINQKPETGESVREVDELNDAFCQKTALEMKIPASWVKKTCQAYQDYVKSTGKHYKSKQATVRNWLRRDIQSGKIIPNKAVSVANSSQEPGFVPVAREKAATLIDEARRKVRGI